MVTSLRIYKIAFYIYFIIWNSLFVALTSNQLDIKGFKKGSSTSESMFESLESSVQQFNEHAATTHPGQTDSHYTIPLDDSFTGSENIAHS